ncbi:MAG TPA: phosphoenolpyruvate synthase [Bacteroidia bacterium]|nr:phosphoenolpyruvate synthase [Bacteroidia bacterium]
MKNETAETEYIAWLQDIHMRDIKKVGGKNASLGEMYNELTPKGIHIPDGFCVTTKAFWEFISGNKLKDKLSQLMDKLDRSNLSNLHETGAKARALILNGTMPQPIVYEIFSAYEELCRRYNDITEVAVRSSATAEDLPSASFAGQHESYLNIKGIESVQKAVLRCFASLFTDRAIKYREDNHFRHMDVALSVCIQKMVRSDLACSGVTFTLEPESGFRDLVLISGIWGLGENIVQGTVSPDEYGIFKPTFRKNKNGIVFKKLGSKEKTMVFSEDSGSSSENTIKNTDTPLDLQESYVLNDEEINKLAQWALLIEEHYKTPMDIEWAKDGLTGSLYIVQARPETAHSHPSLIHTEYILEKKGTPLVTGNAIGSKIVSGIARILSSPSESGLLKQGEILVTELTNPDWDPIMKKAAAIITDKGGRTSHASIVARELGLAAIVGTGQASHQIKSGDIVTVCCAQGETGTVYAGKLDWTENQVDFAHLQLPATKVMLILGDPEKAFKYSFFPNQGIGLMRLEFIINNAIRIHPMALINFNTLKNKETKEQIEKLTHHYSDKQAYFVDKLSQAVATIASAFYPKEVIVRMSDFKSNEYFNLLGGDEFEVREENPMLGFRGASRYYHERYKEGFRLECEAMKKVRNEMGLDNVKLMIPFCRTPEEGRKVVNLMESHGLKRGENGLEIYVMAEIPSNILLAEQFAEIFDGFSIGSNDLTQLTLGIDRDNSIISPLFSEQNEAAEALVSTLITKARKSKIPVGLCGQAPSDFPEYAQFLVGKGIDSISFNPDALIEGITNIKQAEEKRTKLKPVIS